jgi:hypothetical protein
MSLKSIWYMSYSTGSKLYTCICLIHLTLIPSPSLSPSKNKTEQITANLIEFHSCKRWPYSARTIIQQIKPNLLVYHVEERLVKLNICGENCLLELVLPSDRNSTEQLQRGLYYKWSDEGHICSTTLQFNIDYQTENDQFLL